MSSIPKPDLTVAEFIARRIDESGRTQQQIADICGFKAQNMVSHIRYGRVPVPMGKIRVLARALNIDPLELCERMLREYEPEVAWCFREAVSRPHT